jgi:hypothetical protein
MIDLIGLAAVDRETEVTYIQRERDWFAHALADGRIGDPGQSKIGASPPGENRT